MTLETNAKITITLKESSNELKTQIQVHGVAEPGQIAGALAHTLAAMVTDKNSQAFMTLHYAFTQTYFDEIKKKMEEENG